MYFSFFQRLLFSPVKTVSSRKFSFAHDTSVNVTLLLSITLLSFSAFNYGFSDQSFSSCQAMDSFDKQFGNFNKKTKRWALAPVFLSLLNSLKIPAQILGLFGGSYISSHSGRRWCIFLMSIFALISSAIVISSKTKAQILAGRSLHYIYLGMQLAVIPTTLAELAPAKIRGGIIVLYWLSIKIGGLVATMITRRTSTITSNLAWQIPFSIFFAIPTVVLSLVWLTPESPRWLLLRDRSEDALSNMVRLRKGNESDVAIQYEIGELRLATAEMQVKGRFHDIFLPANRKRTFIVVMINFFQQATGQAFSSQYGTLFVKRLGTVNPFSITVATNGINVAAVLICLLTVDKIGRRSLLCISAFIQVGALMTMGALGTLEQTYVPAIRGIVAMLIIYSFGWSVGAAPLTYVLSAELPSPVLREDTLRVAYTVKLVTEFIVSFTEPYLEGAAYADLGGKLGFIYGSLALCSLFFTYLVVPEMGNMELEDIDRQFRAGYSGEKDGMKLDTVDLTDPTLRAVMITTLQEKGTIM